MTVAAEEIAVVPGAHRRRARPAARRRSRSAATSGSVKPKQVVNSGREQGVDGEVVEAREEALLGDAEDARDHGLEEVRVALEALASRKARKKSRICGA